MLTEYARSDAPVKAINLAAQITDFESALLSKRTQLVVGKLSFLLYSSFQRQRVDQSDINQWLDLGEIEALSLWRKVRTMQPQPCVLKVQATVKVHTEPFMPK